MKFRIGIERRPLVARWSAKLLWALGIRTTFAKLGVILAVGAVCAFGLLVAATYSGEFERTHAHDSEVNRTLTKMMARQLARDIENVDLLSFKLLVLDIVRTAESAPTDAALSISPPEIIALEALDSTGKSLKRFRSGKFPNYPPEALPVLAREVLQGRRAIERDEGDIQIISIPITDAKDSSTIVGAISVAWSLSRSLQRVDRTIEGMLWWGGVATAILLSLVLVASYRMVTRPISRLAKYVSTIDTSSEIVEQPPAGLLTQRDEIGVLAREFGTMIHAVIESHRGLETQVAERTHALAATNRDLEQALVHVQEANHAKSQFLASMSHELRTPLNAVIGFSELLTGQHWGPMGSPKYLGYANDILDSGRHLLGLVNDILDVSMIDTSSIRLSEETCDVRELVGSTLRMIEEIAVKKDIRLEQQIDENVSMVLLDERRFRQILLNLLGNAMKFTPNGGHVVTAVRLSDDGGVKVSVEDNGIGIASQNLSRVFERFAQVGDAYTKNHAGVGLGLYITKKLVELHGGSIAIESSLGSGTTVTVTLPESRRLPLDSPTVVANASVT